MTSNSKKTKRFISGTKAGDEGNIKFWVFWLFGKKWFLAFSETKWHSGEEYKNTPIWKSSVEGRIPCLFIGKFAIGYEKKKK